VTCTGQGAPGKDSGSRGNAVKPADTPSRAARDAPWPASSAFAARLKDAVDLDSVRTDLADVVQESLEPAYVPVWMSRGQPG
jgi:hypothetical protein